MDFSLSEARWVHPHTVFRIVLQKKMSRGHKQIMAAIKTSLFFLLLFVIHVGCTAALPDVTSYDSHVELSPDFHLFWTPNKTSSTVHVAMRARTTGWLAFGISEVGSMVGSGNFGTRQSIAFVLCFREVTASDWRAENQ